MGREGFCSCTLTDQCPRLTSRVPATRTGARARSGQEKSEQERLRISPGEERKEEGAERPYEACAHQPPYPKSGTAGSGSPLPEPAQH